MEIETEKWKLLSADLWKCGKLARKMHAREKEECD
jgi:hypothetical protein